MGIPNNVLINVNFPDVLAADVKGVRVTRQGVRAFGGQIVERTDPRGGTYYWIAYAPGAHEHDDESDLTSVRSGYVSVTPLHLDLTHEATRLKLAQQFKD
jgi:5'-nucleotidase